MVENPGHFIFRRLLNEDFNKGSLDYTKIGRKVISAIVDVAAKKVPADLPFSNKQLDQLVQKVKFVPVPKNIIDETVYEEEIVTENGA